MSGYKKYDDSVKEMIIKSGNPNLLPHLKIPRTTAITWIRNAKRKIKVTDVGIEKALENKIERLEAELELERTKNLFMREYIKNLSGLRRIVNEKKNRELIVNTIEKYKPLVSINKLCQLICIRPTKFFRLRVEVKGCPRVAFNRCKILSPNQVTFREQEKIHELINDPQLRHLSVRGLQYHGFRNSELYFGYDTWRKYVYEFKKRVKGKSKKRFRTGVRASRTNEMWHMDITIFKLTNGKKAYLQVLMDNYSRRIINWELSHSKSKALTIKNLGSVLQEVQPRYLLTDAGGENINHEVKKVLLGKNISNLIAKKDIVFSNSMVESFFNTLKNRLVDKEKYYRFNRLFGKIMRAVDTFNKTPNPILEGATPNEIYHDVLSKEFLISELKRKRQEWRGIRPVVNRFCARGKAKKSLKL